jgi:hypothetical protein
MNSSPERRLLGESCLGNHSTRRLPSNAHRPLLQLAPEQGIFLYTKAQNTKHISDLLQIDCKRSLQHNKVPGSNFYLRSY